ncbi:MAG: P-loop NTPase, partial [Myxococcota bacterium]
MRGEKGKLEIDVTLPTLALRDKEKLLAAITEQAYGVVGRDVVVDVHVASDVKAAARGTYDKTALAGIQNVVLVASGKGGVGKSTVASNLAVALARLGCSVGLLDADVYGPSVPHLLGLTGRPGIDQGKIVPMMHDPGGEAAQPMPVMSMGFMVPPGEAVVWRGPMLHGAITQMLRDTLWGPLDYLIIDMPPGTGDIALTLSQALPLTGAVVVCTP